MFLICLAFPKPDEGSEVMNERRFFQALGDRGPIQSSEKGGDDEQFEQARQQNVNIQKVIRQLYRYIITLQIFRP